MGSPDDFLAHHGVKGMKWGFRKPGTGKPSRRKKGDDSDHSDDAKTAAGSRSQAKSKGVGTLSNHELRRLNERLNLEQNYRKLTAEKSKITKGHDAVKVLLGVAGTAGSVYALTKTPAFKAGKAFLEAQLDASIPAGTGLHRLAEVAANTGPRHRA